MFVEDRCVKHWRDGLAETTFENRLPIVEHFFGFIGMSPSEAVDWQHLHPNDYRLVDLVYDWIERWPLRVSTKKSRTSTIRGFFLANRAPMPRDRHRFHSDKEPTWSEMTVDDFRTILPSCNLVYRAAFLVQWYMGGGVGQLIYVNMNYAEMIRKEVRKGKELIRVVIPGRKHTRNIQTFYSFIGPDAIEALRHLFHSQGWKEDTVLFRNEYRRPLSAKNLQGYFLKHAIKVGAIKRHTPECLECGGETVRHVQRKAGTERVYYLCSVCRSDKPSSDFKEFVNPHTRGTIRYRMKTHELRDLFRTEFHRASRYTGADLDVAKFIMGHGNQIDPNKYDKIMRDVPATTSEYRKALPFLNILSEDPRKMSLIDIQERDKKLMEKIKDLETLMTEDRQTQEDTVKRLKKLEEEFGL